MDVAEQLLLDIRVSVRDPSQVGHRDTQCIAGNRHQASIGGALYAEHRRHTDETKPSDHRDLDRPVTLCPHQQRRDTAFDEIDVLDGVVVVLKNCPALQRDGLQEGTKSLERRRRKSGQQAVLDPDRLLAVGNAQRTVQRYPMACPRDFSDRALSSRDRGFFSAKLLPLQSGVTRTRARTTRSSKGQ